MPLIKSGSDAALKKNIAAEIGSGRPRDQSLAIAFRVQREAQRKAAGGEISTPFFARSAARQIERAGMIKSPVAGRTDRVPMAAAKGSFVLPADVVSAVGQGNSISGANAFNKLFKIGPYGAESPHVRMGRSTIPKGGMMKGRRGFADGGDVGEPVDILAAGGEFLVPPEAVLAIGNGDIAHGHDILDAMVKRIRSQNIKTLKNLPGPKSS